MKKKVLWLVAARSGSKTIPNKNVNLLGGHPLLSYRIRTAMSSHNKGDVWISTDSEDYVKVGLKYGATAPYLRPTALANDESSSMDVVLHAMYFANDNHLRYDYIALLEPTSPFISGRQLDEAIGLLDNNLEASCIVAVKESRPHKTFVQEDDIYLKDLANQLDNIKSLGRQAFRRQITPSGGFYISRWNDFLINKTFYNSNTMSYEVDEIGGLEIDEPLDWLFAKFVLKNNLFDTTNLF